MNIVVAVDDVRLRDERIEERDRGLDTIDDELPEGPLQPHQALITSACVHDELADQTVIIRGDGVAGICARIDRDTEACRRMEMGNGPRRGPEGVRVLGVDAALYGVAVEAHVLLSQ